jgi:hypothetical protein
MLINSPAGRWSLLLIGLISAHNNDRQGTAETGITNVLWGLTCFPHLAHFLTTLTTTNCQRSVHLNEKYDMRVYMKGSPPCYGFRAALGGIGNNWSARGSPQQR